MIIKIKVKTNSRKKEINSWDGQILKISVTEIPEKNKANKGVISLLSVFFNCSKSRIKIKSGNCISNKFIEIEGCDELKLKSILASIEKK